MITRSRRNVMLRFNFYVVNFSLKKRPARLIIGNGFPTGEIYIFRKTLHICQLQSKRNIDDICALRNRVWQRQDLSL